MRVATSESFGHLDLRLESSPSLVAQFPDGPSGYPMTRSLRSLSEMSQNCRWLPYDCPWEWWDEAAVFESQGASWLYCIGCYLCYTIIEYIGIYNGHDHQNAITRIFHGITTLGCWTSQEVTVSSWFTKQYPYGISPLYPLGMPPSNTADFQAVGFRWLTVTWAMGRSTSLMPPGCDTDGTSGGRGSVDFCKSKSHLWISRNSWNWSVLYNVLYIYISYMAKLQLCCFHALVTM